MLAVLLEPPPSLPPSLSPSLPPSQELDPVNKRPVVAFYGVPFAAPPVGDLRFAPPASVKAWSGVLDCTAKKLFQVRLAFPS